MLEPLLLPSGALLRLGDAELLPERVTVNIHTTATSAVCPGCQSDACRVHSRYQRTLADLPLAHIPVCLHLHLQRFFCDNGLCPRKTFSEPVPGLTLPRARRTTRLLVEQRHLGLEIGGEPGARLARRQGMAVSADTLLRLARREPATPASTPRHLGIDDFALRKGQVYGTILVDLDAHQPFDLIPERSAEVVEEWLKAHPGVEVITRDRSGEYAEGASRGAPNALQVADRFHLLQNLREMLQRLLDAHQEALVAATRPASLPSTEPQVPPAEPVVSPEAAPPSEAEPVVEPSALSEPPAAPAPEGASSPLNKAAQLSQERRARRQARYTEVREFARPGGWATGDRGPSGPQP